MTSVFPATDVLRLSHAYPAALRVQDIVVAFMEQCREGVRDARGSHRHRHAADSEM